MICQAQKITVVLDGCGEAVRVYGHECTEGKVQAYLPGPRGPKGDPGELGAARLPMRISTKS